MDKIDPDIRSLVRLFNKIPGISTEYSCSGHCDDDEAYILFNADFVGLKALLSSLNYFKANLPLRPGFARFFIEVVLNARGIRYRFTVEASSTEFRLSLLRGVEAKLNRLNL